MDPGSKQDPHSRSVPSDNDPPIKINQRFINAGLTLISYISTKVMNNYRV